MFNSCVVNDKTKLMFELVDFERHICKDGSETLVKHWRSNCRQCGSPFVVTTPWGVEVFEQSNTFSFVHCAAHRLPKDHYFGQIRDANGRVKKSGFVK